MLIEEFSSYDSICMEYNHSNDELYNDSICVKCGNNDGYYRVGENYYCAKHLISNNDSIDCSEKLKAVYKDYATGAISQ